MVTKAIYIHVVKKHKPAFSTDFTSTSTNLNISVLTMFLDNKVQLNDQILT